MYLDIAENRAKRQIPMKMKDWVEELDTMLKTNRYELLSNFEKFSKIIRKAETVFTVSPHQFLANISTKKASKNEKSRKPYSF